MRVRFTFVPFLATKGDIKTPKWQETVTNIQPNSRNLPPLSIRQLRVSTAEQSSVILLYIYNPITITFSLNDKIMMNINIRFQIVHSTVSRLTRFLFFTLCKDSVLTLSFLVITSFMPH